MLRAGQLGSPDENASECELTLGPSTTCSGSLGLLNDLESVGEFLPFSRGPRV